MAMFGRKKPMFGGIPSYTTAGIGDDIQRQRQGEFDGNPFAMTSENGVANIPIGQAPVSGTIPMGQMQQQPQQQQRFKPNILGVIGDAMQVFGGGQATYMQGMQVEQQRAQMLRDRADQQQQQRQMQREDMQWEWDNKPKDVPNNDTVNDLNWYKSLSDADRKLYHQMKPTISYRADGTPVAINPYDLQQGGQRQGPQVGHVEDGHRFKGGDPANPASWEKIGGSAPQTQDNFPVSYEQFKRAIISQESGGRYGIANSEGSGALGLGQIMPETAKALSRKLGLPYRPDLLAGNNQAARQYQEALTDAAVKEAWQYGGAGKDPRTSAQYYFAGPDKKGWGPKTRRYGQQVLGRIK